MRFYVSIRSYDDIRVNYTLQRVLIRLFRYFHTNLLNRLHVTDNTTLFKVKQIINSEQRERNNAKFYTSIKYINKNVERRKTKKNRERKKRESGSSHSRISQIRSKHSKFLDPISDS
jgi:hypothetical protein